MPIEALPEEPAVTVTCATTASVPAAGPSSGAIQNTAPSLVLSAESTVHALKSMPMDDRAPLESPLVMPTSCKVVT